MLRPMITIAKMRTCVHSLAWKLVTTVGRPTKNSSAMRPSQYRGGALRSRLIWTLNVPHGGAAEDAVRLEQAEAPEYRQRHRELQVTTYDVGAHQIDRDADDQAADHRTERAVDPTEDRRGERVDDDRLHHVRLEQQDGRDHDSRPGAYRRGEAPTQRKHPADTDTEEAAGLGVVRRGAQREPDR